MRNIVFFTEPKWAFGSIHYSLCKLLYPYDINAEVLSWENKYSLDVMKRISERTDYFVTTPVGVIWLLQYGILPKQIISVAHGQWDILLAKSKIGLDIYKYIHKYGTVSDILKQKSIEFGVDVDISVVPFGIHFDRFYSKPSNQLKNIGMGGEFESQNFFGHEIKRGRLVKQLASNINLNFIQHDSGHYLSVPSYYNKLDAVLMASSEEGAGLPMMEAAAAGRLTLGTPVGYFEHHGALGGGIHLPIDEDNFVQKGTEILNFYKNNSDEYVKMCNSIQEYARENYNWDEKYVQKWAEFLS